MKLSTSPFSRGFGRIAVEQLDKAAEAAQSLTSSAEGEALHDFRVSLRRLSTLLKAYRSETGKLLPGKSSKRLKKLFESTNPTRDAQVELAWLAQFSQEEADEPERPGLSAVAQMLQSRLRGGQQQLLEKGLGRFWKTEKKLRKRLSRLRPRDSDRRFQDVARPVLRKAARKTQRRLEAMRGGLDVDTLHRARIAVKRLRYLVEPFRTESKNARELVVHLRELQDFLGEIHDRDLLAQDIAKDASLARPILKLQSERRLLCEKALNQPRRLALERLF